MIQHFSKTNDNKADNSHLSQLNYSINTPSAGLFYQINLSPAQNLNLSLSPQQKEPYQTLLQGTKRLIQNSIFQEQQPDKIQNNFPSKKRTQGSFSNLAFSRTILRLTQQRKNNDIEHSHAARSNNNNSFTLNSFSPTASYFIPSNPSLSMSPETSTYQPSLISYRHSTPQHRLVNTKHKSVSVLHTRPSTAKSFSDCDSQHACSTSAGWNLKGKKQPLCEEDIKDIELIGVRITTDSSKHGNNPEFEINSRRIGIQNVQKQHQKEKKVINSSRLRKFQEKLKAFKESKDNQMEQGTTHNGRRFTEECKDVQLKLNKSLLVSTATESPYVKAQRKGYTMPKRQFTVHERNGKRLNNSNSFCFHQPIDSSGKQIFTKQNTSQISYNNRSQSLSQSFSQSGQQMYQPFQAAFIPEKQHHSCLSVSFPSKSEIKQQNASKLATPTNKISNKMQKPKKSSKVIIFSPSNSQLIRSHIQPTFFIENGLNNGNNFSKRNCSTAPSLQLHQTHPQESSIDPETQRKNESDHNKRDSPELGELVTYYHFKYEEKLPNNTMDTLSKNKDFSDEKQREKPSISAMGPWIHPSEYIEESLPQSRALKGKK